MKTTNRVLVWDLPTRIFHWLFAGGFFVAAIFAFGFGEHSPFFSYHAIFGLIIFLIVVLRVLWGFIGTRYARFDSFTFSPKSVFEYLKGALRGDGNKYVGHNPGSAYAIFAMLIMMIGLGITGIMLGTGNEWVEELHEILAYAMISVVVLHIMGVLLHIIRHRENIIASMIHGKKEVEAHQAISSSRPIIGVIFLVLTGAWAWGLYANYDASIQSTRLPLIGTQLQIGEIENEDEPDQTEDHGYKDDHDEYHEDEECDD
ncbi:putative cytochrome b [Caldithrix abyssi DSM 13497]|uniref:Cytochrome b n=1 Tax=Caldithrix abyssi DSM 13497 TaxID=880073 RepID=H1XSM8_CALAY|nr:cytochrome b/b6 domain-containing protein [Caldithrix abyssi]APF18588.1 Cytochrome b [Caldithrix abyssi DSM 13497]EHO42576.1 putative cytochrome b [Caldithrix abyssi DSM 13497]